MRFLALFVFLFGCVGEAAQRTIAVLDEQGRGLTGAEVEAVLTPPDDPRLASVIVRKGATDPEGRFRYDAEETLILVRVRARKEGHHGADADHRHGLGRPASATELTLTLPRIAELVPLHYREVSLSGLPEGKQIGFDAEAADVVAPWGKGRTTDFELELRSEQVGWTESAVTLAELRKTAEAARMDDREWALAYGHFRGSLRLTFPRPGDGIAESAAFWPYCRLKMPAQAPEAGYASERTVVFDTLPKADTSSDFTGCYLRLRTQLGLDGRPASARFAKIQGRIIAGPGRVAFRFYYNPRADDRRLAFDLTHNLLILPAGASRAEQESLQAFEP